MGEFLVKWSYRWFDLFNYPDDPASWRWYHHITFLAGSVPLAIGYGLVGRKADKAWNKQKEEENELQEVD